MQAPAGQTVKPPPFRIAQIDGISVKAASTGHAAAQEVGVL